MDTLRKLRAKRRSDYAHPQVFVFHKLSASELKKHVTSPLLWQLVLNFDIRSRSCT